VVAKGIGRRPAEVVPDDAVDLEHAHSAAPIAEPAGTVAAGPAS
jgi:PTS system fructose-specific IIC component